MPSPTTPETEQTKLDELLEELQREGPSSSGEGFRVILYNDDWHGIDEVALQLVKATGYDLETCWNIMMEAHHKGRAVCYRGERDDCHRVAKILREIRLQVEVDCD